MYYPSLFSRHLALVKNVAILCKNVSFIKFNNSSFMLTKKQVEPKKVSTGNLAPFLLRVQNVSLPLGNLCKRFQTILQNKTVIILHGLKHSES